MYNAVSVVLVCHTQKNYNKINIVTDCQLKHYKVCVIDGHNPFSSTIDSYNEHSSLSSVCYIST